MNQSRMVESYYDFLSEHYDAATLGKFEWKPPREAEFMLSPLVKSGDHVLDLGIGTGQSAAYFLNLGAKVCGLDISEKMLQATRIKYPQFELHKADLNSELSMLEGRQFDVMVSIGVLEFVNDLGATFKRALKHLKQGGLFCFTIEELVEGHKLQSVRESASGSGEIRPGVSTEFKHHRYSRSEIEDLLEESGLRIREAKRMQAYLKSSDMIPIQYWMFLVQKA